MAVLAAGFACCHGVQKLFMVVVLVDDDKVKYVEQVPEIAQEPNYDAALKAL